MTNKDWTPLHWLGHKLIHWTYDLWELFHDWLINFACEHNLWQTPEQRAKNESPRDE